MITSTAYRMWGWLFGPISHASVSVTVAAIQLWDGSGGGRTPDARTKTLTINPPSAGTIYVGTSGVSTSSHMWEIRSTSSGVVFDCDPSGLSNFYAVSDAGGPRTVSIGQGG